jgi:hypothetical protein
MSDGLPQSVPDWYVPDEFRAWGVPVVGFETVTSTRIEDAALRVKRTRALPAVGCEADAVIPEVQDNLIQPAVAATDRLRCTLSLGFDHGGFAVGPESIADYPNTAPPRWHFCLVDPDTPNVQPENIRGRRRARLEFGLVSSTHGAVDAYIEVLDGPFCGSGGEILPGWYLTLLAVELFVLALP